MPLKLPRLISGAAIVDQQGKPNGTMVQWWQQVVTQIETAIKLIVQLTGIQDQFEIALQQAQQATADAQAAAQAAQGAADAAQVQTDAAKREAAIQGSYIEPASVVTASTTTVFIAAHTRYYPQTTGDPIAVSVNAGSAPATGATDTDYVYYLDPDRAGGAVDYQVTTTPPTQTGDTHVVGAVTVPNTGTSDGGEGPRRPGYVAPRLQQEV